MNSVTSIGRQLLYVLRPPRSSYGPDAVLIDICTACGARCLYCLHQHGNLGKRQLMNKDVFMQIADILAREKFKLVLLYMSGEPFLHPDLPDFVVALTERGMDISIATKLHVPIDFEHLDKALCHADLTGRKVQLLVTVDTLRADTQRKIAPGIDTTRVRNNLAIMAKLRDQHRSLTPECTTVVNRCNEEQLEEIRSGLADLGFKSWCPRQMGYYMGYMATQEDLTIIRDFEPRNSTYRARFQIKNGKLVSFMKRCDPGPPAITPEADITVCCHDMLHILKLGNVLQEGSVRRILASETFRKTADAGRRMKLSICKGCN